MKASKVVYVGKRCFPIIIFMAVLGLTGAWAGEDGTVVIYTTANAPKVPTLAELPLVDKVSDHGITWTFDKKVSVGRFVNGNWYVVGPATVVEIDPKPVANGEVRNGFMLNPPIRMQHSAFDSRLPHPNWFGRDLVAQLPVAMKPGDALMSSISLDKPNKDGKVIKSFSILTCLKEPVPADAFRPGYCDRQQDIYLARNLKREKLMKLPVPKDAPDCKTFEAMFERPWYELTYLEDAQAEYQERYGRSICEKVTKATFLLLFDFKPEEKERLLQNLVQYGLDIWGCAKNANGKPLWVTIGGWGSGRKWPVVFAGMMLGEDKLAYVNKTYPFFQEDEQTAYDDCWTGAGVVWSGHNGHAALARTAKYPPGWGPYEHTHPSRWVTWDGPSYRSNMTSSTWIGQALVIRIMQAEKEWGYDAWLDYCDRWMYEPDPGYQNSALGSHQGHAWVPFFEEMWKIYRENLPVIPGKENAPRPPTGWQKKREMKSVAVEFKKGAFLVQGKPFFPLLIFAEQPKRIDDAVAIGANTIAEGSFEHTEKPVVGPAQCFNNRKFMDQLAEKGLYGVFGADMRVAGHPNLLGWIHLDEPDRVFNQTPEERAGKRAGTGSFFPSYRLLMCARTEKDQFKLEPEEQGKDEAFILVRPACRWMKKADPTRPIFLTLGPTFFKAVTEKKELTAEYLNNCDVAGCRVPGSQVGEAVAKLKELTGGKPVFAWVETKGAKPEDVRTVVRTAIAGGATAIGYRGFEGYGNEKPDAAVMAELKRINDQITAHAAELLADPGKAESLLK